MKKQCTFYGLGELVAADKSVTAKLLISRTILHLPKVGTIIIDPKQGKDFCYEGAYRGENAPLGLKKAFEIFQKRKSGEDENDNLIIVFIDEFQSLINLLPTKKIKGDDDTFTRGEAQEMLNLLVALSRSYSMSIQCATQQPNSQVFGGTSSREQFGFIGCLFGKSGGGGSETLSMLFDTESCKIIKNFGSINGRGGFVAVNGGTVIPVRVPKVNDMQKMNDIISSSILK